MQFSDLSFSASELSALGKSRSGDVPASDAPRLLQHHLVAEVWPRGVHDYSPDDKCFVRITRRGEDYLCYFQALAIRNYFIPIAVTLITNVIWHLIQAALLPSLLPV